MKRLVIAAASVVALACAAPAAAQTPVVVAQAGLATLTAVDRPPDDEDQTLELGLQPGPLPDADVDEREQVVTPFWPDEVALVNADVPGTADGPRRILVGGVAPIAAAVVELQFAAARIRVPTVAGDAYRGADAGRIRFFLTELTLPARSDDSPDVVRLLDAGGRVIGVSGSDGEPAAVRSVTLRQGLRAVVRPRLAPTPLQPERVESDLCLVTSSDSICRRPGSPSSPLELDGDTGCGRTDASLTGFVPDGTRQLVVLLGSGRRVRLPARALPASLGVAALYVAGTLPRAEAVRAVQAVDAGGRVLARDDEVAAPPGDRRCRDARGESLRRAIVALDFAPIALGTPPGTQVALPYAAGPRLVVREVGDLLCVGFDRLAIDGSRCLPPPLNSRSASAGYATGRGAGGSQRAVAALVAAPVAFVDLLLRGGGRLRLPTVAGDGYSGRFQGHVRFLLATLAADQTPRGGLLLDAAGRRVGSLALEPDDERRLAPRPRTLARAGAVRLLVGRVIDSGEDVPSGDPCLLLTIDPQRPDPDGCAGWQHDGSRVTAIASCSPRALVLHGTVRRTVRRVELRLASGRRLSIPTRAFPRSLRSRARYYLTVLPRDAAVEAVRFPGHPRASGSIATPLVPATRQCGYRFDDSVF